MRHRVFSLLVVLSLLVALVPAAPQVVHADEVDYGVAGGHFFAQTTSGGKGYTIVDDGSAPFWREFNRLGGVQGVGYPISRRFMWNGFLSQAMQRVVFQWRPDTGQVAFVNVFDLMTQAGKDDWLASKQTPRPLGPEFDAGKSFEEASAQRLALLDDNAAIRRAYYNVAGDPVQMNGLPTSRVTDMGNNLTLRAQRVVIQQWKENVPWAAAGQVTVALGGSLAAEAGLLPGEALAPEDAPARSAPVPLATGGGAPPPSGARPVNFGYGFQIDANNDYGRALNMTRGAGFNWSKVQIRWAELESQPGAINWGPIDNAVNGANGAGVSLLLSVVTAPDWSRPGQNLAEHGPPNDPQAYANFVGAIAARHPGKVQAYEIWNEQNLAREWGGPGRQSAAQYVGLLRAANAAIKASDPNTTVLVGALTPAGTVDLGGGALAIDDIDFLQQMYAAGMRGHFDAIAVHPSGFNSSALADPRDGATLHRDGGFRGHRSFYFRNFEFYRDVMVRNGDAAKQLWFTEFGWASGGDAGQEWAYAHQNSEEDQANFLVQAFQYGRNRGYVGVMIVWNLNFSGVDDGKRAFSVLRPDWAPRPAYNALAALPK